jgi:quinol monooxygenase YgiN
MIVEYIRYRIPEDQGGAFEDAYRRASASLEASPHCEGYEVARRSDDPTAYTVRIEWDSVEGHMTGFRNSPEFRGFFAAVQPFVGQIEEMKDYDVVDTGAQKASEHVGSS